MTEALGDATLQSLKLEGETLRSDVAEAVTSAAVERTIDGAPTLTVGLLDSDSKLLRSGIFGSRLTSQVDDLAFELVQINKSGRSLTLTFEDLAVAALRRHTNPRKAAAGTTTRLEFAKLLVSEEPWIKFYGPMMKTERAKIELARGEMGQPDTPAKEEDTWTALDRLAKEVGWTRYSRKNDVWFLPEAFLFLGDPEFVLIPNNGPVHDINFDFDIGKPVAKATADVDATRWAVAPGSVVLLEKCGPADGKWLVESISRSLFSTRASIGLRKPSPVLPEPDPPPAPTSAELGDEEGAGTASGGVVATGATSSQGYVWPCRGRISSGFGPRGGRLHAGLDIAVGVGTPIGSTKKGTVVFAGTAGGYGNAVYIDHGGVISRYGHLSRIECRRGQTVATGERIGLSGGAKGAPGSGNSQGPHLHFEIRPGNSPADPRRFLP